MRCSCCCSTASAYTLTRAIESGSSRWMVRHRRAHRLGVPDQDRCRRSSSCPGFALVFLLLAPMRRCASGSRPRSLARSPLMLASTLVGRRGRAVAGVGSRPYIGGSQNNSALELILGYNGLGRMNGNETGSITPGGGGAQGGMWGETGWSRMFTGSWGGQASWLIPTALLLAVAMLVADLARPRTDRARAAVLLWGSWLVVTGLVFSFAQGIIHEYYAVALAPAIGALVGIGAVWFWQRRDQVLARAVLAVSAAGHGVRGRPSCCRAARLELLARHRWSGRRRRSPRPRCWSRRALLTGDRRSRAVGIIAARRLFVGLAGPAAYSLQTASVRAHRVRFPTAGPTVAGARGWARGGRLGRWSAARPEWPRRPRSAGTGAAARPGPAPCRAGSRAAASRAAAFPGGGQLPGRTPQGGRPGHRAAPQGGARWAAEREHAERRGRGGAAERTRRASPGRRPRSARTTRPAISSPAASRSWRSAGSTAPTRTPRSRGSRQLVAQGKVHWFISGGGLGGGGNGGAATGRRSLTWVAQTYTAQTIGGVTMYDLTGATTAESTTGSIATTTGTI